MLTNLRFRASIVGVTFALSSALALPSLADEPYYGRATCCAFSWTGFYVGLSEAWAKMDADVSGHLNPLAPVLPAELADINRALTHSFDDSTFIGGGQLGYNRQAGSFVYGLEADIAALRARDSVAVNPFIIGGVPAPGNNSFQTAETTFLATVRPRVGVVFDRALFYATGGLAIGDVKYSDSVRFAGPAQTQTTFIEKTKAGWTVGGGVEYAFGGHWSGKVEYLHVDLGSDDSSVPSFKGVADTDVHFNHSMTEEIVRVGINYKFGRDCCAAPLK